MRNTLSSRRVGLGLVIAALVVGGSAVMPGSADALFSFKVPQSLKNIGSSLASAIKTEVPTAPANPVVQPQVRSFTADRTARGDSRASFGIPGKTTGMPQTGTKSLVTSFINNVVPASLRQPLQNVVDSSSTNANSRSFTGGAFNCSESGPVRSSSLSCAVTVPGGGAFSIVAPPGTKLPNGTNQQTFASALKATTVSLTKSLANAGTSVLTGYIARAADVATNAAANVVQQISVSTPVKMLAQAGRTLNDLNTSNNTISVPIPLGRSGAQVTVQASIGSLVRGARSLPGSALPRAAEGFLDAVNTPDFGLTSVLPPPSTRETEDEFTFVNVGDQTSAPAQALFGARTGSLSAADLDNQAPAIVANHLPAGTVLASPDPGVVPTASGVQLPPIPAGGEVRVHVEPPPATLNTGQALQDQSTSVAAEIPVQAGVTSTMEVTGETNAQPEFDLVLPPGGYSKAALIRDRRFVLAFTQNHSGSGGIIVQLKAGHRLVGDYEHLDYITHDVSLLHVPLADTLKGVTNATKIRRNDAAIRSASSLEIDAIIEDPQGSERTVKKTIALH